MRCSPEFEFLLYLMEKPRRLGHRWTKYCSLFIWGWFCQSWYEIPMRSFLVMQIIAIIVDIVVLVFVCLLLFSFQGRARTCLFG